MRSHLPFALAATLALPGCSLFHSNINGGFACAAPHGTCAPSMVIDDAALRAIGPQSGEHTPDDQAGSATSPSAAAAEGSTDLSLAHDGQGKRGLVPGARPALKVVYPAWRGPNGAIHARMTAYAPVNPPPTPLAAAPLGDGNTMGLPAGSSLLAIAEMAPETSAMVPPATTMPPKPSSTSAPTAANPIDAIKQRVSQILSALPKPVVAKPPAAPRPSAGASFPPAGN